MKKNDFSYEVKVAIFACFNIYTAVIIERIVSLIVYAFYDINISMRFVNLICAVGLIISTSFLACIRGYDLENPDEIKVYGLNRVRALADFICIVLIAVSGAYSSKTYCLYMCIATVSMLYDVMLSVAFICFPLFVFNVYGADKVRLHCYTRSGYIKCISGDESRQSAGI